MYPTDMPAPSSFSDFKSQPFNHTTANSNNPYGDMPLEKYAGNSYLPKSKIPFSSEFHYHSNPQKKFFMHTDLHQNHQSTYKAKNIAFGTVPSRTSTSSIVKPSGSFLSSRLNQGVTKFAH
jgi:hypothetical protein